MPRVGSEPGLTTAKRAAEHWLHVSIADDSFALPVPEVQEIVRVVGISKAEDAPYPASGSVRLRRRSIPVVDLRHRLGLGEADPVDSRLVVVRSNERTIGLLVDTVEGIVRIDPETVEPLPDDARGRHASYIAGVHRAGKTMTMLLDLEQLLCGTGG